MKSRWMGEDNLEKNGIATDWGEMCLEAWRERIEEVEAEFA